MVQTLTLFLILAFYFPGKIVFWNWVFHFPFVCLFVFDVVGTKEGEGSSSVLQARQVRRRQAEEEGKFRFRLEFQYFQGLLSIYILYDGYNRTLFLFSNCGFRFLLDL